MTSTELRLKRIERDGAPELVKAVKSGKMGSWTAQHLISDKFPKHLQALIIDVMENEVWNVAVKPAKATVKETPKAKAVKAKKAKKVKAVAAPKGGAA